MLNINPKYEIDIQQYCKLNNIEDVNLFVTQCFKQGFDIKKYGFLGNSLNEDEKHLKTEVIVEKRVEVPVEVIVEKEIIKEIPVEVIKEIIVEKEVPIEVKVIEYVDREVVKEVFVEVPVEKIVTKIEYISDKTSENELLLKIQQLDETIFHLNEELVSEREEFSTKTQELTKIFQDKISKKDEELDELRRNLDEVLDKPPVEVIKEVVSTDNSKQKMLESTLQNLRKELANKNLLISELEQKNKQLESQNTQTPAMYLKGSNLSEKI
jgi:hypothetical protein